jgi:hypothetical protein
MQFIKLFFGQNFRNVQRGGLRTFLALHRNDFRC